MRQGDYERATALRQELLALAHATDDTVWTAWALLGLGDVAYYGKCDAAQMERFCGESLTLCREVGNKQGEGFALNTLALAAWLQRDVPRATALFADSQALFRELGYRAGVAEVLSNVGRLACEQGHREQARAAFRESLALAHTAGPMPMVADDLEGLAGVAGAQQQAERVARLFGAAYALREAKRMRRWPLQQALYDRDVAATRAALGEDAFAAAGAAGQALSLGQAIAEAVGETPHASST
jgi:tetratricopeptide (TPR) repeat protein